MIPLLWILLLGLAWLAATGDFSGSNLVIGLLIGYVVLLVLPGPARKRPDYGARFLRVVAFFFYFLSELMKANVRVASDVIRIKPRLRPGVVAIPLTVRTDAQIALLANLITLTPGTLSLDVSDDRRVLYIHAMYVDDPDEVRREIKEGFERHILELTA